MSGIKKIIQKKRNNNANKIKKETVRETLEEFRVNKHNAWKRTKRFFKNYIFVTKIIRR